VESHISEIASKSQFEERTRLCVQRLAWGLQRFVDDRRRSRSIQRSRIAGLFAREFFLLFFTLWAFPAQYRRSRSCRTGRIGHSHHLVGNTVGFRVTV
jgi:hypothetical protein